MASSSLSFCGIEPQGKRRKVDESSRQFDVFINHRGPDVKQTVALQLYNYLKELGIDAFLDSEEKELGDSFPSTIENAIRSASAHIAIFSEGYAESPWCLEELFLMLQSRAKIVPVFYGVKPSDLRHIEKGKYADAFTKYEEKRRYMEKLKDWKETLQSVSFLTGYEISSDFNIGDCRHLVSSVEKEVQRRKDLHVAKYPVGLPRLVEDFERQCLDKLVEDFERQCKTNEGGKDEDQIVGIFGMGGVGKTTLAKELFNRKRSQYTQACFLFNVREAHANRSFPSLQLKLLTDLFQKDGLNFLCTEEGKSHIGDCIRRSNKPSYLIVLDDIDHLDQLDALLIMNLLSKSDSSLVIVTTRDAGVLVNAGIRVGYHLKGMDRNEAKELFCWHSFHQSYPFSGYEDLVDRFVDVCGGIPLSLQVLGSHVCGENQKFWEFALQKVRKTLPRDIQKSLRTSTEMLDYDEKQIFMDVACFFIGELKENAIRVWEASGWSAQHAIRRLKDKCLVEEIEGDYDFRGRSEVLFKGSREDMLVLRMHDHLRDLGREMADELNHQLSHPRRLWRSEHLEYLESNGFENILTQNVIQKLSNTSIMNCGNLITQTKYRCLLFFRDPSTKFLVKCFLRESGNMAETSPALLWLELNLAGQALTNIPPWIPLQNLQSLRIANGRLERLWQNNGQAPFALKDLFIYNISELGELSLGLLQCLEELEIYNCCKHLKSVTGISDLKNLVKLNIERCMSIEELCLAGLSCLNEIRVNDCWHLKSVTKISDLKNLVKFNIERCMGIEELCLVGLSCLNEIRVEDCGRLKSVTGISDLKNLVKLNFGNCVQLEELSLVGLSCIKEIIIVNLKCVTGISDLTLTQLVKLNFTNCWEIEELSLVQLSCLEEIRIYMCGRLRSVTGISDLTTLEGLYISDRGKLQLQELSLNLPLCLKYITIHNCKDLKSLTGICDLMMLVELDISYCEQIEDLSLVRLSSLKRCTIQYLDKLKTLEVKGCENLLRVHGMFENLVELNIMDCPMLGDITGITELHSLGKMQVLHCSNETIHKCFPKMKKLPTDLIKVIGRAVEGAESTLSTNLFCDFILANSVMESGTDNTSNHLGRHVVGAIILCALVVVDSCTADKTINDSIKDCDWYPWVKFEVRQGEWIITSVTTREYEIMNYILNKGYCFPFDCLSFPEDVRVKKVTMPVMRGEEHKILDVLHRIVDKLYQKETTYSLC